MFVFVFLLSVCFRVHFFRGMGCTHQRVHTRLWYTRPSPPSPQPLCSSRGRGIRMVLNPSEVRRDTKDVLVQHYIDRPYTINNYKVRACMRGVGAQGFRKKKMRGIQSWAGERAGGPALALGVTQGESHRGERRKAPPWPSGLPKGSPTAGREGRPRPGPRGFPRGVPLRGEKEGPALALDPHSDEVSTLPSPALPHAFAKHPPHACVHAYAV